MRRRYETAAIAWAAALVMAGCSTPGTRVVLLPQEDGSPSAVIVRTDGGEQRVSQPYQRATALRGSKASPSVDQADPAAIQAEHKALFALAPPKAQQFNLFFDAGGTTLTAASLLDLDRVIEAALARTGADITVTGHTDSLGKASDNDSLSLKRALEIKRLLVAKGFPADRIEAIGRGERELAVPTADEVDEPRNRRVVIVVR